MAPKVRATGVSLRVCIINSQTKGCLVEKKYGDFQNDRVRVISACGTALGHFKKHAIRAVLILITFVLIQKRQTKSMKNYFENTFY